MDHRISLAQNIRPILASIKTVPMPVRWHETEEPGPAAPFITISRHPGAGALKLAREFVEAINAADPKAPRWTCWDRELVEKIAADHHLSKTLIDSLEETSHLWLSDVLSGLFSTGQDELAVYHRVAHTIRALAQVGRVVIVGRGGTFITRNMDGGVHVRLVAPLEQRIKYIASSMHKTIREAAEWIMEQDKNRTAFYKRVWRKQSLQPEDFTITINTAEVDVASAIQILIDLIKRPASPRGDAKHAGLCHEGVT